MTLAQISMTKSSKATPLGEIGGLPRSGASAPDRACSTMAARTIEAAIMAHGGEATSAVRHFMHLSPTARSAVLTFLRSL